MHITSSQRVECDISSCDWYLTDSCSTYKLKTQLPADVLDVLQRHGVIEDPLYRYNELSSRWVGLETWILRCEFDASLQLLQHLAVDMLLSGVDTVADLVINGKFVTQLENAFREYRVSVKSLLHPGKNVVELVFHSAITEAKKRAAAYPYKVPSMQGPGMLPHYNFIRKPACDFGWDWGPAFAAAGVYGGIKVVGYTLPYITSAVIHQRHHPTTGIVSLVVDAYVCSALVLDQKGLLSVSLPGFPKWCKSRGVSVDKVGVNKLTTTFDVQGAKLWWPAGYGDQNLYEVTVTYEPAPWEAIERDMADMDHCASSVSRQIGFRHVELVRNPIADASGTNVGETFYFKVNGVPIFVRGANVIPSSICHSQETDEKLRDLVEDAASAHMNMLRVWGGGLYLPCAFYQECDQLGIMVWQEAMFACSPYPRNSAFLNLVSDEVRDQTRRLGSHACIVIWGGNNEVEQSLEWYPETRDQHDRFIIDYSALFFWTMRKLFATELPHSLFVDGSPSNGLLTADPLTKRWGKTNDPNFGDVHFYNYVDDVLDSSIYPKAHFVSEYGYMSMPSWETYKTVTIAEDWSPDSRMSQHRMRHPNGNTELLEQLRRQLRLPPEYQNLRFPPHQSQPSPGSMDEFRQFTEDGGVEGAIGGTEGPFPMSLGDEDDASASRGASFRKWIYLTQVLQSMAYCTAVTHWRRLRTNKNVQCGGILYWQLNDVAQFPSWSSINHGGTWKLMHYAARRFFAPVMATCLYKAAQGRLEVHVTNDRNADFNGHVLVSLVPWQATSSADMQGLKQVALHVAANSSAIVWEGTVSDLLSREPDAAATLPTHADTFVALSLQPDAAEETSHSLMRLHLQAQYSIRKESRWSPDTSPLMAFDQSRAVEVAQQHRYLYRMPDTMRSTSLHLLGPLKDATLRNPGLRVRDMVQVLPTQVDFVLCAETGIAVLVALETSLPGVFSDNCLSLVLPWAPQPMSFFSKTPFTLQQLINTLHVMSLYESYQ